MWAAAAELWPPIQQGRISARWTGLRPGTIDGLPVLGELAPGMWAATGHFRNGILLAPATARALRLQIMRSSVPVGIEPFSPMRFATVQMGALV